MWAIFLITIFLWISKVGESSFSFDASSYQRYQSILRAGSSPQTGSESLSKLPMSCDLTILRIRNRDGSSQRISLQKHDTVNCLLSKLAIIYRSRRKQQDCDFERMAFKISSKHYLWKELMEMGDSLAEERLQLRQGDWIEFVEGLVRESNDHVSPWSEQSDREDNIRCVVGKETRNEAKHQNNRVNQSNTKRKYGDQVSSNLTDSNQNDHEMIEIKRQPVSDANQVLVSLHSSLEVIISQFYDKGGVALLFGEIIPANMSTRIKRSNHRSKHRNLKDVVSLLEFYQEFSILAAYEIDKNFVSSLNNVGESLSTIHEVCLMAEKCGLRLLGVLVADSTSSTTDNHKPKHFNAVNNLSKSRMIWSSKSVIAGLKIHKVLERLHNSTAHQVIILGIGDTTEPLNHNHNSKRHSIQMIGRSKASIVVEVFHLNQQSFALLNKWLEMNADKQYLDFNSTHIQSPLPVKIGSQLVHEIPSDLLAVPLAFELIKQRPDSNVLGFQTIFPSLLEEHTDNRHANHRKIKQVANDYVMKILKRLGNHQNQRSPLDIETIGRLQDLHLLEYLRKYFSASAFSSLCFYIGLQRRLYHHPARQVNVGVEDVFVPSNVQMEAKFLLQSFSTNFDEDL